jgi:hypothetical protein
LHRGPSFDSGGHFQPDLADRRDLKRVEPATPNELAIVGNYPHDVRVARADQR